jgi:Domain of unknown function (DUF4136)
VKLNAIIERKTTMWQECQNGISKFAPVLLLTLVACTVTYGQDVRTNYMPGTDFSKYHTYAWVSQVQGVPTVGVHPDQILDAQVKQAIDSQMAARGFVQVQDAGKADLLLGYQLAIDQEKQINGFGDSWGGWGGWGPWGPGGNGFGSFSASTSSSYIGTFVVGMYDPAAKKLVWIGAAQHAIEPSKNQAKNQERLNKGAQKLLKDFPPGHRKYHSRA